MNNPYLPITIGMAGSTAVVVDIGGGVRADEPIVTVELLEAYATACPPSMPTRPTFTGGAVSAGQDVPRTYQVGTILHLYAYEANALITLNAAEVTA